MLKAYKYRIYPNDCQTKQIEQTIGCCRLVYNLALQVKITAYKDAGIRLSAFDLCYQLVDLKQEYTWLKDVCSQSLQASVKKVDVAFNNFFNGNGYPKYKNKKGRQVFQCPTGIRKIDFENGLLTIPKIPNIPIIVSRVFEGEIKTITISRNATGKYYASILVDNKISLPEKVESKEIVGIDIGIKSLYVTSEGIKIDNPQYLKNVLKRIGVLQRRLRNKKIGSSNKKKAYKKIALLHEKAVFQRSDFLHKRSRELVNSHDTLVFETLRIRNMVKNHKLAKSIHDVSWGLFIQFCKYKAEWAGKNIFQIPAFEPSTKMCSKCKSINNTLTLADREWTCVNCGELHDRDENAAKNIKQYFLNYSGLGTSIEPVELPTLVGAMKQE